jgi:hypothetical protein
MVCRGFGEWVDDQAEFAGGKGVLCLAFTFIGRDWQFKKSVIGFIHVGSLETVLS